MSNLLMPTLERSQTDALSDIEKLCALIGRRDFCYIPGDRTKALLLQQSEGALCDLHAFTNSWSHLCLDDYMADGGTYRKRRHATLSALPSSRLFHVEAHQPHFQSLSYNNLNGGIARHYEPIEDAILRGNTLTSILTLGCDIFGRLSPYSPWHIEVHQFRIEAGYSELAKPTPEGVHRDGVSFVMMLMVRRTNIVNGATTIYDLEKRRLDEFTLTDSLDMAIVNDERVMHGVTPIIQLDVDKAAYRDVLVVTFRRKN